jgi:hypothetical protein
MVALFFIYRKSAPRIGCEIFAWRNEWENLWGPKWRDLLTKFQEGIIPPLALTIAGPEGCRREQ